MTVFVCLLVIKDMLNKIYARPARTKICALACSVTSGQLGYLISSFFYGHFFVCAREAGRQAIKKCANDKLMTEKEENSNLINKLIFSSCRSPWQHKQAMNHPI